jgi:Fur family ferric uptake transcriptional regulator
VRHTRQADVVDAVLAAADGFRSAQDLYAELRGRGERIGLSTVYRRLGLLVGLGRVDVVHPGDGEALYRLCGSIGAAANAGHHHHVVCRVCGRSVEVAAPEVEQWASRVAAAAGYSELSHTVEVFGLCGEHGRSKGTSRRR